MFWLLCKHTHLLWTWVKTQISRVFCGLNVGHTCSTVICYFWTTYWHFSIRSLVTLCFWQIVSQILPEYLSMWTENTEHSSSSVSNVRISTFSLSSLTVNWIYLDFALSKQNKTSIVSAFTCALVSWLWLGCWNMCMCKWCKCVGQWLVVIFIRPRGCLQVSCFVRPTVQNPQI